MLHADIIINRLAFIKYLYSEGVEKSKLSEPLSSLSVLHFHDSIEMFLKLLAEHLDIKSDNFNFLDYWEKIPTLTLKESCRALNNRRVNLKHKGLLPSKTDIEISKVTTFEFFEQNTPAHFKNSFNEVSLLSLIKYKEVKDILSSALASQKELNYEQSIVHSAIAFNELLGAYESNKRDFYSPFHFSEKMRNNPFLFDRDNRPMKDFSQQIIDTFKDVDKVLKIVCLGIDYKKFIKFDILTPYIGRTMGGIYIHEGSRKKKYTEENSQFCIDFVLECTIRLQEFDFDIQELIHPR